jgi:hypothetical protein
MLLTHHLFSVDVELPLEYDDEYWDTCTSAPDFVTPPTQPSRMAGFIHFLKLYQIQAFALRNLVRSLFFF